MSSTPCAACSWTDERQKYCSYESHVKLFYEASNRGAWSLGSKMILKDRGPSFPTFEVSNTKFVQEQTSIPVPNIVESWEEGERTFILMRRIQGEPLSKAWPTLSTEERERIAKQTVEYLQQLRNLQCDKIQSLGGHPVISNFLFHNNKSEVPHGPISSDSDLWDEMKCGLKDTFPEDARAQLQQRMPPATPYTFTHGDLTNVNIMVCNGSLTGIIDWERSGYFPVWWEYVGTSVIDSEEDREWKELLRKYMPDFSAAREFWRDYWYFCRDLGSERAVRFLEETRNENPEGSI